MVSVQLRRIKKKLEENLVNLIDMSDSATRQPKDKEKACLSRSYTAYSLVSLASAKEEEASQAIVDGFKDNGIDAIYYEEKESILWLVQGKWIESGNGEPETGEVGKFIQGIKDIIDFKFSKFNERVKNKQPEIEKNIDNPNVKIKIVLAYSGSKLGPQNEQLLSEFITELNIGGELFSWQLFSLSEAYDALSRSLDSSIDRELKLINWGLNEKPYKTWYGQIDAEQLALLWLQNKEKLFFKNIRSFVGLNDVNDGIKNTLLNDPETFLYLNNGVTVLCSKIQKTAKGSTKSEGKFHCERISIINGAQTVGTIGTTYEVAPEKVKKAKVFIKLISLENCPPDFDLKVTKATNTQNKVENLDFISLDSLHDKLKQEFALDGINYHYKRDNNKYPSDNENCTVEEATIALACGWTDIRYAHIAKDKIGKLWGDVNKPPYTDIFNSSIKVKKIWRMIKIMRAVNNKLLQILQSDAIDEARRATCIHGNKFILHMVFQYVGQKNLFLEETKFDDYLTDELPSIIDRVIEKTGEVITLEYPTKIVYQFFRNLENYNNLKQKVLELYPLNSSIS